MARMTAQDMVTEARLSLGGETTETITDTNILRWLNRAYLQIASLYAPPGLESSVSITTASGTAEYASRSSGQEDILNIISIIDDTNNVVLYPIHRWQYDRWTQGDASNVTGTPIYWFESGTITNTATDDGIVKQFTFYPTPAGTYTLNLIYTKSPTELVISPSATYAAIGDPWDEVILLWGISKGWAALGDKQKTQDFLDIARDAINVAKSTTGTATYVPYQPGSVIGGALR